MLFELKDLEGESCGLVKVTNFEEGVAEMDDDMVDPVLVLNAQQDISFEARK